MVEQWTENPCVPGSIPGGTTNRTNLVRFFYFQKSNSQSFSKVLIYFKLHLTQKSVVNCNFFTKIDSFYKETTNYQNQTKIKKHE